MPTMPTPRWTPLHDRLHQTIRHRGLFAKGQSILVAVSGGQDSLCLARLLLDLQPKWHWRLAIAHCNHRWAVDSPDLPGHVEAIAEDWNLPFHLITAPDDVAEDSREAIARNWRYQALSTLAIAHQFDCVTTGHTASDRAETLLYNLMRGSGIEGLSALGWSRPLTPDITLVRPMLTISRAETGNFCQQFALPVWDDPANTDLRYARNRIRSEVLPYLAQHFNPNVEQTLATTVEVLQADADYLESEADRLFQQVVEEHGPDSLPVKDSRVKNQLEKNQSKDRNSFEKIGDHVGAIAPVLRIQRRILGQQALSLQRRVMRKCLLKLLPKAPTFEHIEKLSDLIHAPNRSQTDPFPGGAIARVKGDWIEFFTTRTNS
ncbi:MAG: tRNA lysidine(34) synthetase TilS [Leptolyngbyaceae bacterium]|nr:tRNA lysidine(34) synthetase TilS [Leptolyngbyaceae bacterium]